MRFCNKLSYTLLEQIDLAGLNYPQKDFRRGNLDTYIPHPPAFCLSTSYQASPTSGFIIPDRSINFYDRVNFLVILTRLGTP